MFPIKDLTETNPLYILTNKDKTYVEGTKEFKDLLKNVVQMQQHGVWLQLFMQSLVWL